MKVQMVPRLHPRRGGEVVEGNVYTNPHGRAFYKVVMGIIPPEFSNRAKYNNVVMMHVDSTGHIVGASVQPMIYVSEHQDLVGVVRNMPSLKIEWLQRESSPPRKKGK